MSEDSTLGKPWHRLREEAQRASDLGRFEEAAAGYRNALSALADDCAARADDWNESLLDLEVDLGRALQNAAQLEASREVLESAVERSSRELGRRHRVTVRAGLALGVALFREGRIELAGQAWTECQAAIDDGADVPDDVRTLVLHNLGGVHYHRGDHGRAIESFERSLAEMEARLGREHRELTRPLASLAWLASEAGRQGDAEQYARRAVAVSEKTRQADDPEIASGLHTLALILVRQDRLHEAMALFERVLDVIPAKHHLRMPACINLADLYRDLGDLPLARRYAREAARLSDDVHAPADPFRTAVHRSLAFLETAAGNHAEAIAAARRAIEVEREVTETSDEIRIANRGALAQASLAAGEHQAAVDTADEGLRLLEAASSLNLPEVTAKLRLVAGCGRIRAGHARAGLTDLDTALAIGRRAEAVDGHLARRILDARIEGLSAVGDTAEATRAAEEAIRSLTRTRVEEFALLDSAGMSRRSARGLAWFDRILCDGHAGPDAVRGRAEAWFDHHHAAAAASAAIVQWHEHATEQERAASANYRALLRSFASEGIDVDPDRRAALRERLAVVERSQGRSQIDAIERALGPVRVADVAARMAAHDALVAIAWLDPHVVSLSVDPSGALSRAPACRADDVLPDIRALRRSLEDGHVDEGRATRVARALLGSDVAARPGLRKLTIVPDGAAALLPWAFLVDLVRRGEGLPRVQVVQAPSVRRFAYDTPARMATARITPSVAFVDPDFGAEPTPNAFRGGDGAVVHSQDYRRWLADRRLPRLGHAREEAEIVRGFDSASRTLAGTAATARALAAVHRPRVLHVATHGFVYPGEDDMGVPLLRPVLALAGARSTSRALLVDSASRSGTRADTTNRAAGFVPALAMAGLDLRGTELVVLSACESSIGSVVPGEGVAGMPQALLSAGAAAVIATLWRVRDRDAVEVVRSVYRGLSDGLAPSEALGRARRDVGTAAAAFVCWT